MTAPLHCLEEAKVDSPGQRPGFKNHAARALKGRNLFRPFGADACGGTQPRALPWAIKLQAFGLGIRALLLFAVCLSFNTSLFASQAQKQFNEADAELNATYQKLLAHMTDSEGRQLFIAAQRAWVQYRDANVKFSAHLDPASKGGLFLKTDLTEERVKYLKQLLANPPDKAN
jgi:uncharacterized protein YecT (DUF1311 family)